MYLQGNDSTTHPSILVTNAKTYGGHLTGMLAHFVQLIRRPKASPKSSRIVEQTSTSMVYVLMKIIMSSSKNISLRLRLEWASGASMPSLEECDCLYHVGESWHIKSIHVFSVCRYLGISYWDERATTVDQLIPRHTDEHPDNYNIAYFSCLIQSR